MSTMTMPVPMARPLDRSVDRRVSRSGDLRLTRRGRLVVLLAGLIAALTLGVVVTDGSAAGQRPGRAEPTTVVTVGSGDTLWGIAAEAATAAGEDDVRAMVSKIQGLNALDSGMVLAGQRLRVPAN